MIPLWDSSATFRWKRIRHWLYVPSTAVYYVGILAVQHITQSIFQILVKAVREGDGSSRFTTRIDVSFCLCTERKRRARKQGGLRELSVMSARNVSILVSVHANFRIWHLMSNTGAT